MKFSDYISSKKIIILLQLLLNFLVVYFYLLTNSFNVFFVLLFINLSFIIYFVYNYFYFNKIIKNLIKTEENLDKKFLIKEVQDSLPYEETLIIEVLEKMLKSQYHDIKVLEKTLLEERENKLMWVHELKQPLAILKEDDLSPFEKKKAISKINNNLNNILFYEKIEEISNDLSFKKENLKELINESIKNFSYELVDIDAFINVDSSCDKEILTDRFWFIFILNQLLSNSIKYKSKENLKIDIFCEVIKDGFVIIFKDNGIGINDYDLKNIFDKGYRGINAKDKSYASGYGLYYVKEIIRKLNASIKIMSNDKSGICVNIKIINK